MSRRPLARRTPVATGPHPNWQVIVMAFAAAIVACIVKV